jgi:hypothetical protein
MLSRIEKLSIMRCVPMSRRIRVRPLGIGTPRRLGQGLGLSGATFMIRGECGKWVKGFSSASYTDVKDQLYQLEDTRRPHTIAPHICFAVTFRGKQWMFMHVYAISRRPNGTTFCRYLCVIFRSLLIRSTGGRSQYQPPQPQTQVQQK